MKYTATELARLALYLAAAAAGVVLVVFGARDGNMELVGAGVGLLGTGGVAAAKTNKSKPGSVLLEPVDTGFDDEPDQDERVIPGIARTEDGYQPEHAA